MKVFGIAWRATKFAKRLFTCQIIFRAFDGGDYCVIFHSPMSFTDARPSSAQEERDDVTRDATIRDEDEDETEISTMGRKNQFSHVFSVRANTLLRSFNETHTRGAQREEEEEELF